MNYTNSQRSLCILSIVAFCMYADSCKKFVSIPPPVTQVTAEGAFSGDGTAIATVQGLYSQIMASNLYFLNGAMTVYPALSADELYRTSPDAAADQFTNNAVSSRNNIIENDIWANAYKNLYQVNACLEGLSAAGGVSTGVKERLSGELKFTRALCYFYLVNLFGDVPKELTTAYTVNASLPRTPVSEVYQQIISDLADAQRLLPSAGSLHGATEPSGLAATSLLARVWLYRQNWAAAEASSATVINSGVYHLENDVEKVFLPESSETIFQLVPVIPGVNTAEGLNFIPSSSTINSVYAASPHLVTAFEKGDNRKTAWLDSSLTVADPLYYPYKYKKRSRDEGTEYSVVLRLAEQYLVRAEAKAQQGNIPGAVSDVNIIRQRAGLPLLPEGLTKQECLAAVANENRIEFFAEWGHRWFDLKRTGEAGNVLSRIKSGWNDFDTLYPIPYSQLQLNASLTQNTGY